MFSPAYRLETTYLFTPNRGNVTCWRASYRILPFLCTTLYDGAINQALSHLTMMQYIHRCPFFAIMSKFRPFHLQYGMKSL